MFDLSEIEKRMEQQEISDFYQDHPLPLFGGSSRTALQQSDEHIMSAEQELEVTI